MRRLGIYLMVLLFIISMSSCNNRPDNSSSKTSSDSSTVGSGSSTSTRDSENTTDSTSEYPSQSTSSSPSTTEGLTTIKNPTTTSTTSKSNDSYEVSLLQYHPGLPGFDAEYSFTVKKNGLLVSRDSYSLSVNDSRVTVKDGKVIVPYSVRSTGKDVVVTVKPQGGKSKKITIPSKKWEITFNDDFDGNDLDSSKWSVFEPYLTYSENPVSYAGYDCYEVSNGSLKLLIKKQKTTLNGKTFEYTDACVSTEGKFKQTLGCYVASMKYEPWSGVCGGYWLLPVAGPRRQSVFFDNKNPNLGCGEVDIIEYSKSFGDEFCVTEHFWNYNTGNHTSTNHFMAKPRVKICDGKFHAIGVVITEDASYYYCDGELVGQFEHDYKTTTPSGQKKSPVKNFMLFSYRMGKDDESNWVGRWNFKDSDFPLAYEVDWCRAYK